MNRARTRVLVVEDSLTVRRRLCEVLERDPELDVVGEAADGRQAIAQCDALRPDVITMDMMLPVMTGLAATEHIMAHRPTPILVVSSSTNRGELFQTYEALAAGAVDVMEKPRGDETDDEWERRFIGSVKLVSRIRVITHPRARLGALGAASGRLSARPPQAVWRPRRCSVIALGASTGGPGALVEVLRGLPRAFALPILLVLHIGEQFGSAFAEWLDAHTALDVRYAEQGQPIAASSGCVLIAPPGQHLVVRASRAQLTREPPRHSCRPSVDVLFESLADEYASEVAACLLTGMGTDGAGGLLRIRQAGGITIAQDEATCVVYGMPREAARLDAAERILPLREIGSALGELGQKRREGQR
jgi:two-component system, chemotaxis family, protein-glutamate methylesterase/glutaminase